MWTQILASIRLTLFCSKPESVVHVTEMIICDLFLFNLPFGYNTSYNNSGCLGEFIVYVAFSHVYLGCQKFTSQTYMVRQTGVSGHSGLSGDLSRPGVTLAELAS